MPVDRRTVAYRERVARQINAVLRASGQAVTEATFLSVDSLTRSFSAAILADSRFKQQQLISLAEVFRRSRTDVSGRTRVHEHVARLAQRSVIQSYAQLITAQEGPASRTHYRAGRDPRRDRLAGGILRRALGRPDFVEAGPDGLRFVNVTMLDEQAAHWHRIAFGAAGAGGGSSPQFEVSFGNLLVATLGYDEPASPAFALPRGFWLDLSGERVRAGVNPAGSDQFYPQSGRSSYSKRRGVPSRLSRRQTRGIVGRDFFAAGLARVAHEFPLGYEQYYQRLYDQYAASGTGPLTINAHPVGRARPFRFSVRST